MFASIRWATVLVFTSVAASAAQRTSSRVRTSADRVLLTALVSAEDSRDSVVLPTDARRRGLASVNPYLRAFTVRGLGRIESRSLLALIAPSLDDSSAEVRAAAADALAQAAVRGAQASARPPLLRRLAVERDAIVRASLLEAIGRSGGGSAETPRGTAVAIQPSLAATAVERRGAIRGLFFLSRKPEARTAGRVPTEVTDKVFAMLLDRSVAGYSSTDRNAMAAILVNTAAVNDARIAALLLDNDPAVRDRAVSALPRMNDTAVLRSVLEKSLNDPAPLVRFRSIGVYTRRLRAADGCAPLVRLARDSDVTVALTAVDALASCAADTTGVRVLDSLSGGLSDGGAWHLPAHAFVSLAATNARRAREMMPRFSQARSFFVRMYADSAARLIGDTATLYVLASDRHPNVQSNAIAGLAALVGHSADSVYISALRSDDNQLLMAASVALKGTSNPAALRALDGAWKRLAASGRQTAKDGLDALQARILELGGKLDGSPHYSRTPPPSFDDLARMENTEVVINMADGGVARMRFYAFDAPTNTARFIRLANAHAFDGLTFHRVAPFFVVQGPSPNANEYSAPDALFTRDELGRENVRATVGLSTRGRDTGDGQIFINLVDNTWLDHEYTVMGIVTEGMEAFDRMQEGAEIARISTRVVASGPTRQRNSGRE